MKIIDLLNKIANGEEVPQKIKVGNKIYNYETFNIGKGDNYFTAEWGEVKGYRINYDGTYYYLEIRDYNLNDEVEILEEEKTPTQEEINEYTNKFMEVWKPISKQFGKLFDELLRIKNDLGLNLEDEIEEEKKIPEKLEFGRSIENGEEILTVPSDKMIIIKINEIIDYLKSKGE